MTINKWILVQMIIIIMLAFFLGYKTNQLEHVNEEIIPSWIASSSIGEFVFARRDRDDGIITLKDLKEVQLAFEFIQRYHLNEDITKRQLLDGAIAGGVASIGDQYSRYVPLQASREVKEDISGFYGGIGILVESVSEGRGCMVTSVFRGEPAHEAGVMAGDIITHVEGKDVRSLFLYEIVDRIKGPEDSIVEITVLRPSIEDILEFEIPRKQVKYPSVFEYKILEDTDGIGYINLIQFNNESTNDFINAVDDLQSQGMKKLILDIRQNTGGTFAPAIEIADIFIDDGVLVYTQTRDEQLLEFKGSDGGERLGFPLVVLVDQFSASASEILAGAIKDYNVGTIIGSSPTTFGKGVVQNVQELPQGGTLILTTSKYLTPNKHDINKKGIFPDILAEIDLETTQDPFLRDKYEKMETIRKEYVELRDELVSYLRDYDFQLDVATEYLTTGNIIEGATLLTEDDIAELEDKISERRR